jgi:hypothetical protein
MEEYLSAHRKVLDGTANSPDILVWPSAENYVHWNRREGRGLRISRRLDYEDETGFWENFYLPGDREDEVIETRMVEEIVDEAGIAYWPDYY